MKLKGRYLFILVICLIFTSQSLSFQASNTSAPNQQDKKQEIPQSTYEVEVIVTNVELIVTDKKGNRVTDLRPENFDIYEDGMIQKLTNFYEVKGIQVFGSVLEEESGKLEAETKPLLNATEQIKNKIIFFFDNLHLHPLNRNLAAEKLIPFIQNNFGKGKTNQGMVVFLDRRLEIIQEFTLNPHTILQAIDRVKNQTGDALLRARAREDLKRELMRIATKTTTWDKYEQFRQARDHAWGYVEEEMNNLSYSLKSLDVFINYLSGIDGRKILIYVCDGLPINPGNEVFTFLEQLYPFGDVRTEAMNYDATHLFKELTAQCNAREISVYPINAERFIAQFPSADKSRGWNRWSRGTSMLTSETIRKNDALKMMANETGGIAILKIKNIDSGLQMIENDLNYYYSLGYKSPHRKDSNYHSIDVKLVGVDKNFNIRIRKGYIKSSPEDQIKENVTARLFLQNQDNPLGIRIQILPAEKLPYGQVKLTLRLLIPINKLALLPQLKNYVGSIKVYISFLDSKKFWSDPYELFQEIKIPNEDYEQAQKRYFPYLAELHVKRDSYVISLAVKDMVGSITSYLQVKKDLRN